MRPELHWESVEVAGRVVHKEQLIEGVIVFGFGLQLVLFLCWIVYVCIYVAVMQSRDPGYRADLVEKHAPEVRGHILFEQGLTFGRLATFAWRFGRAVSNLGFLIYNMATLGSKDEDKPWKLERHILIRCEGVIAGLFLFALLFYLIVACCIPHPNYMAAFSHYLTRSANFSALKSLPLVNPVTAWETVNDTHRRFSKTPGSAFCLVWTIVNVVFCLIPLALMAVLVKVSQLHFVTNGTPWTLQDYLTFVFFINAMAGLRGDIETERLKLLFDGQQEHYNFKAKVAERLVYHCDYGFWTGFVLFVTMSSAEFAQMRGS